MKRKVENGLRHQILLLAEHSDPGHPVVRLAKERIAELSGQAESLVFRLELEREQPSGPTTEQIEALLADTPDLSKEIAAAEDEDLVELLTRFDVRVTFDKPGRSLKISAAIGLDPSGDIEPEKTPATRPDGDRSQVCP